MPYNATSGTAGSQPQPQQTGNSQAALMAANQSPAEQAEQLVVGGAQPGIAQSGLTMAQLLQEIGLSNPTAQNSAVAAADQFSQGVAGLGITAGQQAIQGQGLAAQLGLTQGQQGIEQQQYALSQQQYPEQQAEAATQNQLALQNLSSGGAIGGTLNTQGHKQQVGAQNQSYQFQQADISRAQQNAALGQQSEQMGYNYSVGDIARSQQNLQLAAAANGLSYEQLISQFQQGVSQTGLQGSPEQLYTQYLSQQGGQLGALGTAEGQAGLLVPGSALMNAGLAGGLNLNSMFSGT